MVFSQILSSVPLLFNLYTTLSSVISASTVSHLLYADDTPLFISFIPKNFLLAISDLQSTVSLISSWMSSNYLTLNSSKTEFLLIGLPQRISKITNPLSLSTAKPILPSPTVKKYRFHLSHHSLSFSKQISFISSSCYYNIRDLSRIE